MTHTVPVPGKDRGSAPMPDGTMAIGPKSSTNMARLSGENRTAIGRRGPAVATCSNPCGPSASFRARKNGSGFSVTACTTRSLPGGFGCRQAGSEAPAYIGGCST